MLCKPPRNLNDCNAYVAESALVPEIQFNVPASQNDCKVKHTACGSGSNVPGHLGLGSQEESAHATEQGTQLYPEGSSNHAVGI